MKGISRPSNNELRGMVSSNVSSLPLDTPVNVAAPDVPLRESPPIYVPPEGTWDKVKRLCREYW